MFLNCMTNSVVNGVCHASNFKDTKKVIEDRMKFDVKIHNLHLIDCYQLKSSLLSKTTV